MFDIGLPELVIILVVALLVFGPGKMVEIGRELGKAVRDFRRATGDIQKEFNDALKLDEPAKPPPPRPAPPGPRPVAQDAPPAPLPVAEVTAAAPSPSAADAAGPAGAEHAPTPESVADASTTPEVSNSPLP